MLFRICTKCGNVLTGERPRFCEQCGYDLSKAKSQQAISTGSASVSKGEAERVQPILKQQARPIEKQPLSRKEKQAVYLEKLKDAWVDGKLTVDEAEELAELRERLGISAAKANDLRQKAIESLRPGQKDDFEEKPRIGTSHGIALSVNTNQFYMQGYSGVIDIKLENLSDNAFDFIKVEVSGNLLERSQHWSCYLTQTDRF